MNTNATYNISVDGLKEVKGSGEMRQALNDFLHYWTQYQDDGEKVIGTFKAIKQKEQSDD
jgi:hypothetical protein